MVKLIVELPDEIYKELKKGHTPSQDNKRSGDRSGGGISL